MLVVREDNVEIAGTVRLAYADPFVIDGPQPYGWNIYIEPAAKDAARIVNAQGHSNASGWLRCRVTPVAPYRLIPWCVQLLNEIVGQKVRVGGTWCDVTNAQGEAGETMIAPISWLLVDRGISAIIEEHGFAQVLRDVDVFAFSDDEDVITLGTLPMPHRGEDRHVVVSVPFPLKPQTNCTPRYSLCVDREPAEAQICGYEQQAQPSAFPLRADRQTAFDVVAAANGDELRITIDTGTAVAGQGFFYGKLTLTHEEPFAEMCLPDVCLASPTESCQFTGEYRRTYAWPRLDSARAGDMLFGPADGTGVLGRLLGALEPTQKYDHVVLFVEDDRQTIRHCSASDARLSAERYINGSVTVDYVVGSLTVAVPLKGLRGDVVKFGWPGTATQSLGEVCVTGRNRLNSAFSFASQYADVVLSEQGAYPLWMLAPRERDKRTAFHDAETTAASREEKDRRKRLYFSLPRLQKDPGIRPDGTLLWPVLVQPHPLRAERARPALAIVAAHAKKIDAHYRFFGYSSSQIATDASFNAPPVGSPEWPTTPPVILLGATLPAVHIAGSEWSAGTVAAMCSSFIWAAVQAANVELRAAGRNIIQLEGSRDTSDERQPADLDGLYEYTGDERVKAGDQLYGFMYDKVASEIEARVADDSFPGALVIATLNDTIEGVKALLGDIVANQMCNTFAADAVSEFRSVWRETGQGVAVSPDDAIKNWDAGGPATVLPPSPGPGRVNVYGTPMTLAIPNAGRVVEPIYRVLPVVGQGSVEGLVVRRVHGGDELTTVIGATVRLGCQVRTTGLRERYSFASTKAGRYLLGASMFIIDEDTGVGLEWKSDPVDLTIHDGDRLSADLELKPPPGIARNVAIRHHADIVDRRVVGKDKWGHFDLNEILELAYDPREDHGDRPPEDQRNTRLADRYDKPTPEVGSGVGVHVTVDARMQEIPGPADSHSFSGAIEATIHVRFYDRDEGETNATYDQTGIILPVNQHFELPYDLVSDDHVPERASGKVSIYNLLAVLP